MKRGWRPDGPGRKSPHRALCKISHSITPTSAYLPSSPVPVRPRPQCDTVEDAARWLQARSSAPDYSFPLSGLSGHLYYIPHLISLHFAAMAWRPGRPGLGWPVTVLSCLRSLPSRDTLLEGKLMVDGLTDVPSVPSAEPPGCRCPMPFAVVVL